MKKILLSALALCLALITCPAVQQFTASEDTLRHEAATMLMVGFRGDSITADNPVVSYLSELGVGGIILFDVDLTGSATIGSRNITTRPRLEKLTADIQSLVPEGEPAVLIAVDQEGGRVQRLKPRYGYTALPSAFAVAQTHCSDTAAHYAAISAKDLHSAGINMNLAPEVDIHRDECPVIGQLDRAFSENTDTVAHYASIYVDAHSACGIASVLKHFPGHGSATSDSHYGLTDVTATWTEEELMPFRRLIEEGKAPAIMTAHIFNRNIDPDYPATLSHKTITGLLREQLHYDGLVLTDDMYMQGIIDHYDIADALVLAINAGADMLIVGNNISTGFEADRPAHLVDIIVRAVREGRIAPERIHQAAARVNRLRGSLSR